MSLQKMLVMALMVVSVATDLIQNRRRECCFSYNGEAPASGDQILLAECNPADSKQSKWVITLVSGSQETNNEIVQICLDSKFNLCIGTIKGDLNQRPSVVFLDQDSTDTAQLWSVNPTKRPEDKTNTYTNVDSEKCLHIDGPGKFNSVATTTCSESDKRQHFTISNVFDVKF